MGSLTDVKEIRRRARAHLEDGAATKSYQGDLVTVVRLLNDAVATELVCVLRYTLHSLTAQGIDSEPVKAEFAAHAAEEQQHMMWLCERITQLGGKPDLDPRGLLERAASEYVEGDDLVDMIRENLVAERVAIDTYRELVRHFADQDPTTRVLLEKILAQEEEHATELHGLLVAYRGRPMLHR